MDFKDRKEIILFLQDCETRYQVKDWQVDGLHIWPLLKMLVFFHNLSRASKSNNTIKISKYKRLFIKGKKVVFSFYCYITLKISKVDFVFAGATGHRQNYKGKSFNKFFDPLMNYKEKEQQQSSILFEYQDCNIAGIYKSERVRMLSNLYPFFKLKQKNKFISLNLDDNFNEFLNELIEKYGFDKQVFLDEIRNNLKSISIWRSLWLYIFKKTQPKIAFGLCYYSPAMYAMNIASEELNIPSVDMMHGLQGALHSSYNITEFPKKGYAMLPSYFWLWDEDALTSLNKFLEKQKTHQAFVGGNPWHLFLQKEASYDLSISKKIILVTLQTTLKPILNNFILEAIKDTEEEYQWWLRFHPRMTPEEINTIYTSLEKNNLLHKVEIQKANDLPLPILLANCKVHISKFSGSISEAAMIGGCLNVIIDEIGKTSYQNLLEEGKAVFYNPQTEENLFRFIIKQLQNREEVPFNNNNSDYREVFKLLQTKR